MERGKTEAEKEGREQERGLRNGDGESDREKEERERKNRTDKQREGKVYFFSLFLSMCYFCETLTVSPCNFDKSAKMNDAL